MYQDDFLEARLEERKQKQSFRRLQLPGGGVDFCSNDYLGMVHDRLLEQAMESPVALAPGSTGSRLLTGNHLLAEATEKEIAAFHQAPAALLFNSGYDANLGLLASVPQRGDTILYDALSHASLRDGIRLSLATAFSFAHNDVAQLEQRLQQAKGTVFVVTESVFSMDGDHCPLEALLHCCRQYGAHLVIDEAHATGIVGSRGEGLVQQQQVQDQVFARIHTFGKACGCHGAVVMGSYRLRHYLVNFARSLIYTTALPPQALAAIRASYRLLPQLQEQRGQLQRLTERFGQSRLAFDKARSLTPIQIVQVPGNKAVKETAWLLQQNGLDVRPILSPTVPAGSERLRIVLHAFNTTEQLDLLLQLLGER